MVQATLFKYLKSVLSSSDLHPYAETIVGSHINSIERDPEAACSLSTCLCEFIEEFDCSGISHSSFTRIVSTIIDQANRAIGRLEEMSITSADEDEDEPLPLEFEQNSLLLRAIVNKSSIFLKTSPDRFVDHFTTHLLPIAFKLTSFKVCRYMFGVA